MVTGLCYFDKAIHRGKDGSVYVLETHIHTEKQLGVLAKGT